MAEGAKEAMTEKLKCAHCGDEITDKPIHRWGRVYCSEPCAYEGGRSKGC